LATVNLPTTDGGEHDRIPYVQAIDPEELRRRNQRAIALLDAWERDGDEQEQRETMGILRKALGEDRMTSNRRLF
jgi:hypothetical protein